MNSEHKDTFTIEVPNWCKIGMFIKWYAPYITGINDWVREKIIGYGYDGFFHQASMRELGRLEGIERLGNAIAELKKKYESEGE